MNEVIKKLKSAIEDLEKDYGSFLICALFLREEASDKWDLIVSASWLDTSEMQSYKIISLKLQQTLSDSEFSKVSHIVILNQDDPVVSYLRNLQTFTNGGYKELHTDELSEKFKFTIKRAYLLRSLPV